MGKREREKLLRGYGSSRVAVEVVVREDPSEEISPILKFLQRHPVVAVDAGGPSIFITLQFFKV